LTDKVGTALVRRFEINLSGVLVLTVVSSGRPGDVPPEAAHGIGESPQHLLLIEVKGLTRIAMRERWEQLVRFLKEVRTELKKVNWPPKKEVIGSTIVVIVSVFILSFFLGIVDVTLQKLVTYVLK
jgi:preprotein translocase SecE subunit